MSNAVQAAKTNTFAIVSLVTSFFVAILGIIFGFLALSQIKKSGESGRGLAIAGIIIGFVGVGFWIIWIIVIVAFGALAAATGSVTTY